MRGMFSNPVQLLIRSLLMAAGLAVFFALSSEPASAQCAMCKASLAGNSSLVKNMNLGVLVLLVPPVSIFCTIFLLAIRKRKSD